VASRVREQLAEDETDPTVPRMSANVSATVNATQVTLNCLNPVVKRIGKTFFCGLLLVFSVSGSCFIATIVHKTRSMRKPINFFLVNMAISDLLFLFFLFYTQHKRSAPEPSFNSIQSIWSCIFFPPSLTDQFKAVSVPHSFHLDHRYSYQHLDEIS
ncbi:hypothetical protein pdam_00025779, partial [Pocillopora damicornis]